MLDRSKVRIELNAEANAVIALLGSAVHTTHDCCSVIGPVASTAPLGSGLVPILKLIHSRYLINYIEG